MPSDRALVRENRRLTEKLKAKIDAAPDIWPIMGKPGIYMEDCPFCGNRMDPAAARFHMKRNHPADLERMELQQRAQASGLELVLNGQ